MVGRARRAGAVLSTIFVFAAWAVFGQDGAGNGQGAAAYSVLSSRLQGAEQLLARRVMLEHGALSAEELEALRELNEEIRSSLFGDLMDRSSLLLLLAREQVQSEQGRDRRANLADTIVAELRSESRQANITRGRARAFRFSLGTGAVSFALAFGFWGLGEMQDQMYFQAATIEEAVRHRNLFRSFMIGSLAAAAVGVISSGVSLSLLALPGTPLSAEGSGRPGKR